MWKIYLSTPDVEKYRVFVVEVENDAQKLLDFDRSVFPGVEQPLIKIRTFDEKGGLRKPIPDIGNMHAATILSEKAHSILSSKLNDDYKFVPFSHKNETRWGLYVKRLHDCLDEQKSQVSRLSSGKIWDIQGYVFSGPGPSGPAFFRVPQFPTGELLATQEMKDWIEGSGLTGMKFRPLS